ncbi:MAG: hypothetical protein P1P82_18290 [Bacteroidales bacterium]|nr:hypothetical protein [Bacteroidales bacterium]
MKNVAKLFFWTFLIVAGVLMLMVLRDLINPPVFEQGVYHEVVFAIQPDDSDDWAETAWALGVNPDSLTVYQFSKHNGGCTTTEAYQHREGYLNRK